MKQLIFMIVMTVAGTFGVFVVSPFWGVAVYYLFAVMRPQFLWAWSLPPDVPWSLFVGWATIIGGIAHAMGFMSVAGEEIPMGAAPASPRRFTAAHVSVLLFGLWIAVSYLGALDRDVAYRWVVEYLKILAMFVVSTLLVRTIRHVWILMVVAALSLAYIAYEVNFLYLFEGHYLGIFHNGYGGLDNNGAGLMLAMGVPLCAAVWEGSSKWWRWAFAACIPVLLHAVLLTYSRGAMVALLLASPLILVRSRHRVQIGAAGLCLMLALPTLAGKEIQRRFFSVEQYEQDSSAQSRFASWQAGYAMARDYPILGMGPRNSNLYSQDYGADEEGRTIHSQYLQIAADNGFVGLAIYVCALFLSWRAIRRARRAARNATDRDARLSYAIACGIEGAMATFCIGALFLSLEVFELPYLLLLLAGQLGALTASAPAPIATAPEHAPVLQPAFVHPALMAGAGARGLDGR